MSWIYIEMPCVCQNLDCCLILQIETFELLFYYGDTLGHLLW